MACGHHECERRVVNSSLTSMVNGSARGRDTETRWRNPEVQAAVLNGALVLAVPAVWAAYADYTWDAVRPFQPTVFSSAVRALPVVLALTPVSLLVVWRSYVHARAYRIRPLSIWRGPCEAAAIAGGSALLVMVSATAGTWSREPFLLVIDYIAFYVIATALVGLMLGVVLAATAMLVLLVRGREAHRQSV
jgi:hypothetical protein